MEAPIVKALKALKHIEANGSKALRYRQRRHHAIAFQEPNFRLESIDPIEAHRCLEKCKKNFLADV